MAQKQAEKTSHAAKNDIEQDEPGKLETSGSIDDILMAIDDVLEENAEAFVRSYVQKGGQ